MGVVINSFPILNTLIFFVLKNQHIQENRLQTRNIKHIIISAINQHLSHDYIVIDQIERKVQYNPLLTKDRIFILTCHGLIEHRPRKKQKGFHQFTTDTEKAESEIRTMIRMYFVLYQCSLDKITHF